MPNATVLLSDKGSYRKVEVSSLPGDVRAAIVDLRASFPQSSITIDQLGVNLYRLRQPAPANTCLDVLAVA